MDKQSDKIEVKPEKSENEKVQDFVSEYQTLCEKHQFQIVVQPTFLARDDGTFSVKLISSVGKLPKKS